jgi:hypothetical protein
MVSLLTNSRRYQTLRLVNWPLGVPYPDSSQGLKVLTHWKKGKATEDATMTALYQLIYAMLVGVKREEGGRLLMKFEPHGYRTS